VLLFDNGPIGGINLLLGETIKRSILAVNIKCRRFGCEKVNNILIIKGKNSACALAYAAEQDALKAPYFIVVSH
jgi:hypothetical protein